MRIRKLMVLAFLFAAGVFLAGCGPDKAEKMANGVTYAESALQQIGVNPLATATYQSLTASGGGPAKYINYMLPKKDPVWASFEDGKPTHPWTIAIKPTAVPNEFAIEGYGDDVKKPLMVKYVTIKVPEE